MGVESSVRLGSGARLGRVVEMLGAEVAMISPSPLS